MDAQTKENELLKAQPETVKHVGTLEAKIAELTTDLAQEQTRAKFASQAWAAEREELVNATASDQSASSQVPL